MLLHFLNYNKVVVFLFSSNKTYTRHKGQVPVLLFSSFLESLLPITVFTTFPPLEEVWIKLFEEFEIHLFEIYQFSTFSRKLPWSLLFFAVSEGRRHELFSRSKLSAFFFLSFYYQAFKALNFLSIYRLAISSHYFMLD